MARRGWGPRDEKRSKHMQMEGIRLRPSVAASAAAGHAERQQQNKYDAGDGGSRWQRSQGACASLAWSAEEMAAWHASEQSGGWQS